MTHIKNSMAAFHEAGLYPEGLDTGVVCVDNDDRPLMVAPKRTAKRLGLRCRLAGVLVFDTHKRLWLQRRVTPGELFSGVWNVSAAELVMAGESREDAALRALKIHLFSKDILWPDSWFEHHPLRLWCASSSIPECPRLQVTLFRALVAPAMLSLDTNRPNAMLLTFAELRGLVSEAPELFSPLVRWLSSIN